MATYRNTASLMQAIERALRPRLKKSLASVSTGKVLSVSGKTVGVQIGGGSITAQRYCACKVGDTVLVAFQGTTAYATGVRQ